MTPDELLAQYRRIAAAGHDLRGLTVLHYADEIGALIRERGVRTLLDYGCGAGDAYRPPHEVHKHWGIKRPVPYDPAFPKYARPVEGKFDGVISVDMLEHLPDEQTARDVLDKLFGHAHKLLFATTCCRPAKKTFKDGTNLHTLVRPYQWWLDLFADASIASRRAGNSVEWILRETP